jgi:ribosomal protein L22
MAKQDANDPGAQGADEQPKIEQEAAEAKQAEAEAAADAPQPEAEEKPKPKRRSRAKKAEPKAEADAEAAEEVKQEDAEKEVEAEEAEAAGEPEPEDEKGRPRRRGRRGGAAAAGQSSTRRRSRRREPAADVTVRARAKYVRCAPRKARLVVDHIRGKDVGEARAILQHTTRAASRDVLKLLESAIANAENNHELVADELRVGKAYVDEGPTLKRYRPRALGRATRINKRTSHLTIELVAKE